MVTGAGLAPPAPPRPELAVPTAHPDQRRDKLGRAHPGVPSGPKLSGGEMRREATVGGSGPGTEVRGLDTSGPDLDPTGARSESPALPGVAQKPGSRAAGQQGH